MQSLNHTICIHTRHIQSTLFIQVFVDSMSMGEISKIAFSLKKEPNQIKRQLAEQPLDSSKRQIQNFEIFDQELNARLV